MDIIDEKSFITSISHKLDMFKWRSDRRATCRCPLCGDSKKFTNKCRGEFFVMKGKFLFKCHNCGRCLNVQGFLKQFDQTAYNAYVFHIFRDKTVYKITPDHTLKAEIHDDIPMDEIPREMGICCSELPATHKAVEYLKSRKIKEEDFEKFYHCNNFSKLMNYFAKDSKMAEERLIIPFFTNGKLVGVQGRSYEKDAQIRYISLKRKNDMKMIFNYDNLDFSSRIFVLEGPFDSLFVPNGCAVAGLSNFFFLPDEFVKTERVFILDNQPRNKDVCKVLNSLIESHESVVIWPEEITEKDVNDMVLAHGHEYVMDVIEHNIYSGMNANIKFAKWKRCATV